MKQTVETDNGAFDLDMSRITRGDVKRFMQLPANEQEDGLDELMAKASGRKPKDLNDLNMADYYRVLEAFQGLRSMSVKPDPN